MNRKLTPQMASLFDLIWHL